MSEMNDYSNPATPLMSEKKCECGSVIKDDGLRSYRNDKRVCHECATPESKTKTHKLVTDIKPKCPTCNDETMLNDGIYKSYPCPNCNQHSIAKKLGSRQCLKANGEVTS